MFKETFKYYKSKNPTPNIEEVLDFNRCSLTEKTKKLSPAFKQGTLHVKPSAEWEVYEISEHAGFIYIKNPFTPIGQRYWIQQSLQEFTKKPNKLNIDLHTTLPSDCNWWEYGQKHKEILKKLRWSTLGYHHNWDTKVYSENAKGDFPENLSRLCKHFADALHFDDFNAEAAIVNFYHLDSTLSGHTDHSEEFLDAPLFSFSFGNSAIFLLGGRTIDVKPSAVFIHSGDIVIMSKESRLSYHGVPKIMKCTNQPWNMISADVIEDEKFRPFQEFLDYSRINLNVRQVLPYGQTTLTVVDEI